MSELVAVDPRHYARGNELARGGMGRIIAARDLRLGRPVALKELLDTSAGLRVRFEREARITARLQHPAIVAVHEAGRWPSGEPFYAMKLVAGRSLDAAIADAKTLAERLALLPTVIAVVEALAYAHNERIIHRDLKPANVLVGDYGETVVIDWGLAKDLAAAEDLAPEDGPYRGSADGAMTVAGSIMGTPAFMPPEQAIGEPLDERADVYSLGALLYHVLAGGPPFSGASALDILGLVIKGPPRPLGEVQPGVPSDLLDIVGKAIARKAADRYANAGELAEELRRFQTGKLVDAHRYTTGELVRRWIRKHRVMLGAGAAALAVVGVIGGLSVSRVVAERDRATDAESKAIEARGVADARTNALLITQARAALETDPTAAVAWLRKLPAGAGDPVAIRMIAAQARGRGVAHVYASQQGDGQFRRNYAMSHDGRWVASVASGTVVELHDLDHGTTQKLLPLDIKALDLAFALDDKTLFAAGNVGVLAWDLASGSPQPRTVRREFTSEIVPLGAGRALIKDGLTPVLLDLASGKTAPAEAEGTWLASSGDGLLSAIDHKSDVTLTDAAGVPRTFHASGESNRLALSQTGERMVTISNEKPPVIRAWDTSTNIATIIPHDDRPIVFFAVSPDGKQLAAGRSDGTIALTDLATTTTRVFGGHVGFVLGLAYSADGTQVATAGADGTVRVLDAITGDSRALRGHRASVQFVRFAAGGRRLVSGDQLGELRDWDLDDRERVVARHGRRSDGPCFLPGDVELAASGVDGIVAVTNLVTGATRVLGNQGAPVTAVACAPNDPRIATGDGSGGIRVWPAGGGSAASLEHAAKRVSVLQFSADGKLLVATPGGADELGVDVWTGAAPAPKTYTAIAANDATSSALSPDGTQLAVLLSNAMTLTWRLAGGPPTILGDHGVSSAGGVQTVNHGVAFLPDGKRVASIGNDTLRVWDPAAKGERVFAHPRLITSVAVSPDGHTIATGSVDGAVRLWDLANPAAQAWDSAGEKARELHGLGAEAHYLAFTPDGATLVAAGEERTAWVWDVASGVGRPLENGTAPRITAIAVSANGKRIAATGEDGSVRVWLDDLPRERAELDRWLAAATNATIGDDDKLH